VPRVLEATHRNEPGWQVYRARGWWEDRTTYSLFAEQAAAHGADLAIVDGDTRLTYDELSAAVDRLALLLTAELDVGAGDVVGYQLPNWWETLVVLLACSRIGAVVNPLHLVYRPNDLRYVVQRTRPKVVFVTDAHVVPTRVAIARAVIEETGLATRLCEVRGGEAAGDVVPFPAAGDDRLPGTARADRGGDRRGRLAAHR
jgi:acyl-coenzyme A synthetase/AMP-(fatty) acid ligase